MKKPNSLLRLADLNSTAVESLWPGRLPFGKLTVLDGDPDQGKLVFAVALSLALAESTSFGYHSQGPAGRRTHYRRNVMTLKPIVRMALLAAAASVSMPAAAAAEDAAPWAAPMKKVRDRFTGKPGTLAQFGDSITVSMAFWAPLRGEPKGMPDDMAAAHALVKEYMKPECWDKWRGAKYGNEGSTTIRWAHDNVEKWLKDHNPEVAVIMFGTNDLGALEEKEYEEKTAEVVERCLKNGTIVILTTPPPRSGMLEKSKQFAEVVRRVAKDKKVPLIDYHAEILKRRPDDWDGALPKFKDLKGSEYEVPTLIARDGVHPSYPQEFKDFSGKSLSSNGYALRSYLTVLAYADVVRRVIPAQAAGAAALHKAATFYASFDEAMRGDFGGGALEPGTRSNHETEKGQFVFEKGINAKAFRVAKDKGIHGGALEVTDVLPRNGRIYFPAKGNLAYKKGGWGGAVSVWCSTDPNLLLKTKFCDPIQITQKGANNGGIWFDFNDAQPRDLRHGAFPAVPEGEKAIGEDDPKAPMVRVPKIDWKAGDWHHVVLSWKNFDTGKEDAVSALYIDGKLIGEVKGRAIAMDWDLEEARVYLAVNYVGLLDELALFGRALTPEEVGLLHAKPGLLAELKKGGPKSK
jgi:lysophospholipase L1-like esterase